MSPIRLISTFLARKRDQLAALRDEGGLFENRFLDRLVRREQAAVTTAATQATTLDTQLSNLSSQLKSDLAADDDTPGVLDAAELARLQRTLKRLGHDHHAHTTHLQQLV